MHRSRRRAFVYHSEFVAWALAEVDRRALGSTTLGDGERAAVATALAEVRRLLELAEGGG